MREVSSARGALRTAIDGVGRAGEPGRSWHNFRTMASRAKDFDDYFTTVQEPARTTLEKLRSTIRAAVPDATETISYGMPTFKYVGKPLVALKASKDHCALHTMGYIPTELESDLEKYETGKGTIRFPKDRPLPAALVRKIVKARIAQIESGKGSRAGT
jgi:uncharacterized protein YdhG (YjbR/CyaY superfamily)